MKLKIALAAIIVVYAGFAFAVSRVTPFNKGPDEETNLDYAAFITTRGRLPITYQERELVGKDSNWPALYHLISAHLGRVLGVELETGPHIKIFWDSFRYQAIDYGTEWFYLLTEDQLWPYEGRILVLQLGRWLSILFGVATLFLVYWVARELLPDRPWLALAAVALLAFWPVYTFMSGVMNEDTMMAALATLYLWLLIIIVKHPKRTWAYWALGLALGVSITVKYTTIILPVEVLIVLLVLARQHRYGWGWWLRQVTIVGVSTIVASSWWFGWNFWYLNQVEALGWVAGLLRPIFTGGPDVTLARLGYYLSGGEIGLSALPAGREDDTFVRWVTQTFLSFWGVTIGGRVPLSPAIYLWVALVIGLSAFGLGRLWRTERASRPWLLLLVFHISIFLILPLLRFGLSRRIGETAQGRHILMPAVAAVVVLIVWGVATALPRRGQGWLFALGIMMFVGWTTAHTVRLDTFEPPPVPLRTSSQAADKLPHPVKLVFGEAVELAGYDLRPEPERGRLNLTLGWQSLAYADQNYLVSIVVTDPNGAVVSHWQGHSGQGRLPTIAWDPGDSVFDRLVLPLPNLPAGAYALRVQLLSSGGPLPIGGKEAQAGTLSLADFSIHQPAALAWPNRVDFPASGAAVDFALWQTHGPVEAGQKPTYRYPATISVVTSSASLAVELLDSSGQAWPAARSEAGVHTMVIGPRWPSGDYRLRFGLIQDNAVVEETTTPPVLTVENWWERDFEPPAVEVPLEANFADQVTLLGYKLPQRQIVAGEAFPVTLYWQAPADKSPQAPFTQFNHLLDSSGTLRGGYDRQPLEYYNTLLWAPGEVVVDGYSVPVDANAPPGEYYLNVGYYLTVGESAVNLPLVVDGQMTETSSVSVGPIEVVAP